MKRHAGFTTFTVTLILLIILVGISLLVAKLTITDRRVSLNEVQYRQAMALAELGLADGMGRLSQDPGWRDTSATGSNATGSYSLSVLDDPSGSITIGTTSVTPVIIRAMASLPDNAAQATVEVKAISVKLLSGSPAAPLTVAGGMNIGGNFTAVANPNGGGLGVPLSVWSNQPVGGNGSWQTCHQGDFSGGSCSANISDKNHILSDIKANDANFPTDLVHYLFNESDDEAGWLNIEKRANQLVADCSGLNANSTGLIIVEKGSDCVIPAVVGSQNNPVVLIVRDGSLQMNGGAVFNGLLFYYSSNLVNPPETKVNGTATLNGALVANYPLKITSGTFNAKYDQAVLSNISNGASFQLVSIIPGSWRDW